MLNWMVGVIKNIAAIATFLLALALVVVVARQVIWPRPTLESVSLPGSVQQWGYTPESFAQRISDGTQEIAEKAKLDFDEAYPRSWIGPQTVEAKIPGSDFTTRSAAQFISDVLVLPANQVTGSVTKTDKEFDLSFRVAGGRHLTAKVASTGDSADAVAIVKASSELAMQLVYPYVLAASLYNDEKADVSSKFSRTISILDYMIKNGKDEDVYYAHNLKCAALLRLNKIDGEDGAKTECERAIKIDPANWPARANLGNLYYSLAQNGMNPMTPGASTKEAKENCSKADEQLSRAEISHKLTMLYESWAKCLDVLGREDKANELRGRLTKKR